MNSESEKVKNSLIEWKIELELNLGESAFYCRDEWFFSGIERLNLEAETFHLASGEAVNAIFSERVFYRINEAIEQNRLAEAVNLLRFSDKLLKFSALINEYDEVKSALARKSAKALHVATYEKRAAIVDYWRANIGADKSNEFAAELLQKAFPDTSHRTLARYVSKAKKIPPAGTL